MVNKNDFLDSDIKYVFDAKLASRIGLNNAVVYSNLICQINDANNPHRILKDGKYWIVRSYKKWHKECFPFFSEETVKRIFQNLEKMGAIESCKPYITNFDPSKAYTVNYAFTDDEFRKGGFKIWLK